jgi:hypothetical protein
MSDFENPYKSPETSIVPEKNLATGAVLTEAMLGYLKEASPWLRFIGILGLIGSGLMCFLGIIFSITTSALSSVAGGFANFPTWLLSLIYIADGVLFFFPARFVYNFGAQIRKYQFSGSTEYLEMAFKNNKSLWKFLGILCIVFLAFVPFFIIAAVVAAVTATGLLN